MTLSSVPIERSETLMRDSWMAFDREGRVINCGVLGVGSLPSPTGSPVAKIVCGVDAYEAVLKAAENR